MLYVYGTPVAEYIRYERPNVLIDTITTADVPDEIWDEMRMSEISERGEGVNPSHDQLEREALIDYLTGLKSNGWRMYRYDDRGFANEYTLYLISPDSARREPNSGETIDLDTLDEIADVNDFAAQHLYAGDAATEAYNQTIVLQ